ncbi:hypothetical protein KUTeg_004690 [Tegillarca granosa]|uniref:C-type lectin domain-containing protein n=1 Tax=Tegillarca granosa TaxID=220873 RepID=A0ABQ9FJG5_TEGGR|nr:hypothetical protein KUTeg_004690 [Tegillarca granosa]
MIVADMENLGCDPGWYDNNGYCYLFNNKKLVTRKQANTECSNQNAFLVRIESSDELTFVTQTLANMPSDGFWTDMSDLRFDGTGTGTGHWMWGQYEPIDNTTIKWNKYPTSNKLESCAAVNIQGKFSYITNNLPEVAKTTATFWTGLTRQGNGWDWFNGDHQWAVEPDNIDNKEHCATILQSGLFSDQDCTKQYNYICRKDEETRITCPAGWIMRTNGDCYYFSMPNDTYSWSEASDLCHKKYAIKSGVPTTLLAVNDANEMAWVNSQLAKSKFSANGYWTSLNDRNNEGVWIYHDLFNDQHYDPKVIVWAGEPSDKTGNQDCTYVSDAGRYFDTQCNNKNGFICEKYALGQDF